MKKKDLNKVKQGLKCCAINQILSACESCPYNKIETSDCVFNLLSDCQTAIKDLSDKKRRVAI